jgi:hypothetical protein
VSVGGRGQHAADDGSFSRSAGTAFARGIALIVAAIVLGVVLLNATDKSPELTAKADTPGVTTTTTARDSTTSSTAPAKAHDPAQVPILVANGSKVKGAAGRIAESLKASNYVLKESVNTDTPAEGSVVYYTPGYEADARAVAALLTPPPAVQAMPSTAPVKNLAGAKLLVVVAADLAAGH